MSPAQQEQAINKNPDNTLARLHRGIDELAAQRDKLAAEGAGLLALFEAVMSIVYGPELEGHEIKQRLSLAVKVCNQVTSTTKAIRQIEADGMDKLVAEFQKSVEEGLSAEYKPGADLCLGLVEALARKGRQSL